MSGGWQRSSPSDCVSATLTIPVLWGNESQERRFGRFFDLDGAPGRPRIRISRTERCTGGVTARRVAACANRSGHPAAALTCCRGWLTQRKERASEAATCSSTSRVADGPPRARYHPYRQPTATGRDGAAPRLLRRREVGTAPLSSSPHGGIGFNDRPSAGSTLRATTARYSRRCVNSVSTSPSHPRTLTVNAAAVAPDDHHSAATYVNRASQAASAVVAPSPRRSAISGGATHSDPLCDSATTCEPTVGRQRRVFSAMCRTVWSTVPGGSAVPSMRTVAPNHHAAGDLTAPAPGIGVLIVGDGTGS